MKRLCAVLAAVIAVCAFAQDRVTGIGRVDGPTKRHRISLSGGPPAPTPGPLTLYDNNNIPTGYYYPPTGGIVPADDAHMVGGGLINGFTIGYYDPPGGGDITNAIVAFYANDPFDGSIAGPVASFSIGGLPTPGSHIVTIDLSGGFEFIAPEHLWMSVQFPGGNDAGWLIFDPPSVGSSHDLFLDVATLTYHSFGGSPRANFCAALYAAWIQPNALPVDLSGVYCSGSEGAGLTGELTLTTNPSGSALYTEKVRERSGGAVAQDATYSPFSDSKKPPRDLVVDMRGRSFQLDVDLGDLTIWNDEEFVSGLGSHVYGQDGAPAAWVMFRKTSGAYRVELQTTYGSAGPAYTAPVDATRFRVLCRVDSANATMYATITPLDGTSAGDSVVVGPLTIHPIDDDFSATAFFTGFVADNDKSRAKVTVSDYNTTAGDNAMCLFADDPYVRSADTIKYGLSMANLAQPVFGFQAFLTSVGVQAFGAGTYTFYPFSNWIIDPVTSALDFAAGVGFGESPVALNARLSDIEFAPTAEGAAGVLIDADNGNPLLPTRFSGSVGDPVSPFRVASNVVVVDDTPPTIAGFIAEQNESSILGGTAIQGTILICVQAYDDAELSYGSGIDCRAAITIDFAPAGAGPEDVVLATYSGVGNEFCAEYDVAPGTPRGTATITVTVADNSGNTSAASGMFAVNSAQAVIDIILDSVQLPLATPVVRGVEIVMGGNGGSSPPFYACTNVTFIDSDGPGGSPASGTAVLNYIPCGEGAALSLISTKDGKHTLRDQEPLSHLGGNQYTATLTLKGGDANDDNMIDILDFGIFAYKFGQVVGADTPGCMPMQHPDFSANGFVDTADYTFIQTQFLTLGDGEPGNHGPPGTPRDRVRVREMVNAGVPIARSFDLNGDGWIHVQEIADWLWGDHDRVIGSGGERK